MIKSIATAFLLIYLMSSWANANQFSYEQCVVEVVSPESEKGFGRVGADWIAIHMIQDNIEKNRGIRHLPGLTKISDNGFYFYFYETCGEKLKWSKYYVENFLMSAELDYRYELNSLSPEDVISHGIEEIKKY